MPKTRLPPQNCLGGSSCRSKMPGTAYEDSPLSLMLCAMHTSLSTSNRSSIRAIDLSASTTQP
eukprot:1547679-Rhodomonas_salina.1